MSLAGARDRTSPVTLTESATLPAAGAFEADPESAAMIPIPAEKLTATIVISYTRGASGGQAKHKVFLGDGTRIHQVQSGDGSYDGDAGRASTGAGAITYSYHVDVSGGSTRIGIASAEIGATGTPGSYSSTVTFQ